MKGFLPKGWDWEKVAREPEFEIGPVTFRVTPLNMREGARVFDEFREAIVARIAVASMSAGGLQLDALFAVVFTLKSSYIQRLASDLFANVECERDGIGYNLEAKYDEVMEGMPHIRFYEVVARCFALNFSGSLSVLDHALRRGPTSGSPQSKRSTSTPS